MFCGAISLVFVLSKSECNLNNIMMVVIAHGIVLLMHYELCCALTVIITVRHSSLVANMSVLAVYFCAVEVRHWLPESCHHSPWAVVVVSDVSLLLLQAQFVFFLASGTMVAKQAQGMMFIAIFSGLQVGAVCDCTIMAILHAPPERLTGMCRLHASCHR